MWERQAAMHSAIPGQVGGTQGKQASKQRFSEVSAVPALAPLGDDCNLHAK